MCSTYESSATNHVRIERLIAALSLSPLVSRRAPRQHPPNLSKNTYTMSLRSKRTASSIGKKTTKRARFKTIELQSSQGADSATTSGSTQSSAQQAGHVHIDNINVYASLDGRRIGKQTGTRVVAVDPVEWIFSRAQASDPPRGTAQSLDDDSVAAVFEDLPVHDAEALQDEDLETQLTPKKRVRHDLRAAVSTCST